MAKYMIGIVLPHSGVARGPITFAVRKRAQQGAAAQQGGQPTSTVKAEPAENDAGVRASATTEMSSSPPPDKPSQVEEILYGIVRSSLPLLHITIKRLVEALSKCKEPPDESAYRIISAPLANVSWCVVYIGIACARMNWREQSTNARATTLGHTCPSSQFPTRM